MTMGANLPDLGNDFRTILSLENEKLIGRAWMQQLRATQKIYPDPLINDYVQHLGNRLSPYADIPDMHLSFFVLEENTINAFAFLGGHVGIHSQLILLSETESELAAVMAHEIAHIAQQHILRQIAHNRRLMPITIAEALAAIALGVPDLIFPVLAGHGQQMINHTRSHEQEADRIGIKILADANFDPQGLPDIFNRMSEQARFSRKPPEYISTHPLYESRISDTRNRAESYSYKQQSYSDLFHLIKSRIEIQMSKQLGKNVSSLEKQIKTKRYRDELTTRYSYAYALFKHNKLQQAYQEIQKVIQLDSENFVVQFTAAEIEMGLNKISTAEQRLNNLLPFYQDSSALLLLSARLQLLKNNPTEAKKFIEMHYKINSQEPYMYELLRRAEGMQANQPGVYQANAEWFVLHGDYPSAIQQLDLAIESTIDKNIHQKINTRKQELVALVKKLKSI